MTGRAAGYCAGYAVPGFINPIFGGGFRGLGRGRGVGRGWRNQYYATGLTGWQRSSMGWPARSVALPYAASPVPGLTEEQELEMLKGQADYFENTLVSIRKRIAEIQTASKKTD